MLLLGTKNENTQTVLTNGLINLGNVYRKYCKKINGITTFSMTSNGVTMQQQGIYHITATATFTAAVPGNVTISMISNGNTDNILTTATETIATAATEIRSVALDCFIIVDGNCVLGCPSNNTQTISLINTGVGAVITDVVFNVVKEA